MLDWFGNEALKFGTNNLRVKFEEIVELMFHELISPLSEQIFRDCGFCVFIKGVEEVFYYVVFLYKLLLLKFNCEEST